MIGTFTKNTLITFVTRFFEVIIGVVITIIIARVLGPEKQGIYSLAILLPTILLIFTILGINTSSIFYLGKQKYPPKEVFGNNILIAVFLSIFTILIGLIIIFFFNNELFPGVEKEYLFLALSLIPCMLFFQLISSVLLGLQEFKKYNLTSFLQSSFFLLFVGILILGLRFGIKITILAQIISFVIAGIFLFFITLKITKGLNLKLNIQYLKESISYGFRTNLTGVFTFLNYRINQILINIFINPVAVGLYSIAVKIAEQIWLISFPVATVFFPKVAAEKDDNKIKSFTPLVCRNVLFLTFLVCLVLFFGADFFIKIFLSEKYLGSILPFKILLIGTLFLSSWRIIVQDLYARNLPLLNAKITGFSFLFNIILNFILIPKFGILGAAWATTISYFIMFIITIFIYSRISGNKLSDIILVQISDFKLYKSFLKTKNKLRN